MAARSGLGARRGAIATALAVTGDAPVECLTGEAFAVEIGRLWRDAQSRFLDVGRRLNEACARLERGEYARLLDVLPFERATADKLRKVAMAADGGKLPLDRMPASYSTAYELLTLTDPERAAVGSAGNRQRRREAPTSRRPADPSAPKLSSPDGAGWLRWGRPGMLISLNCKFHPSPSCNRHQSCGEQWTFRIPLD